MQQFTPYFPGYETSSQQQQQQQQQTQDQQQQALSISGPNLAIYSPAAMQPLSVLAAAQRKEQQQQHQQVALPSPSTMTDIGAHGKPKRKQVKNACGKVKRKTCLQKLINVFDILTLIYSQLSKGL